MEVELPLASRTILAGIRVATVTTIGTATIAAAIGGGGLGVFIFRGLASVDPAQILAGATAERQGDLFGLITFSDKVDQMARAQRSPRKDQAMRRISSRQQKMKVYQRMLGRCR